MRLRIVACFLIAAVSAAQTPTTPQAAVPPVETGTIAVPQGSLVALNLISSIKSKSTRPGDPVRAVVAFPLAIGDRVAIPPGTFAEGIVDKVNAHRQKRRSAKRANPLHSPSLHKRLLGSAGRHKHAGHAPCTRSKNAVRLATRRLSRWHTIPRRSFRRSRPDHTSTPATARQWAISRHIGGHRYWHYAGHPRARLDHRSSPCRQRRLHSFRYRMAIPDGVATAAHTRCRTSFRRCCHGTMRSKMWIWVPEVSLLRPGRPSFGSDISRRAKAAHPPTRNGPPHRIPDLFACPPETVTAKPESMYPETSALKSTRPSGSGSPATGLRCWGGGSSDRT